MSEHFVLVPERLLLEPAAIGAVQMGNCQLGTGRRARDMATLPPPTPQRPVLLLLPSLWIKLPPSTCRWWRI